MCTGPRTYGGIVRRTLCFMLSKFASSPFRGVPGIMLAMLAIAAVLVRGVITHDVILALVAVFGVWQILETIAVNQERAKLATHGRSKFASHLMHFYAQAVAYGQILGSRQTDADVDQRIAQVSAWFDDTGSWIRKNMGEPAFAKFVDRGGYGHTVLTGPRNLDQAHRDLCNATLTNLTIAAGNLEKIAAVSTFDP